MNFPLAHKGRPAQPSKQLYLLLFEGKPWSAKRMRFSAAHKQLLRMQKSEVLPFQAKQLFSLGQVQS